MKNLLILLAIFSLASLVITYSDTVITYYKLRSFRKKLKPNDYVSLPDIGLVGRIESIKNNFLEVKTYQGIIVDEICNVYPM